MKYAHAQSAVFSCRVRVADRDEVMFNLEWFFARVGRQAKPFRRYAHIVISIVLCRYHLYYGDQVSFRRSG